MWEKERGYVLSVDPATIACGVSLWKDGRFVASQIIHGGGKTLSHSARFRKQEIAIQEFLFNNNLKKDDIRTVIFEDVRNKFLIIALGIWFLPEQVKATIKKSHFISPSTWKKWAAGQGAEGPQKNIKGLKALREIGWDFETHPVGSDDEADSILQYKAWSAQGAK